MSEVRRQLFNGLNMLNKYKQNVKVQGRETQGNYNLTKETT
jgi:hypothetical protein